MNDLVFIKNNQPLTTSLIIAKGTDNEHESVMRLIKEHRTDFEELWGVVRFSDFKSGNPQSAFSTSTLDFRISIKDCYQAKSSADCPTE